MSLFELFHLPPVQLSKLADFTKPHLAHLWTAIHSRPFLTGSPAASLGFKPMRHQLHHSCSSTSPRLLLDSPTVAPFLQISIQLLSLWLIWYSLEQCTREGNGTPLQYSCLENPMDGGAWWAAVHGVAKSWTWLMTSLSLSTFMHWRRKWQPTPVHSCLENPRDGGAWWAAVYGVAQSRTWLRRLSSSSSRAVHREHVK